MTISSWFFLFAVFLAGAFNSLHWIGKQRTAFILIFNIVVYSLLSIQLLPALILFCAITYGFALLVHDGKFKSLSLFSVLIFFLLCLGLFILAKIWPYALLRKDFPFQLLIPMGFSYICLQNIGFVIDTRNKKHTDFPNIVDFFASSMFFANITSGPITDLYVLKREIALSQNSQANVQKGILRLVNGFFKKSVSDIISVTLIFPDSAASLTEPKLFFIPGLLMKFYLDFSGYIDMAIGAALILGIRLPENFNRPYSSVTMADYWNRWHMTLGHWFKTYFFYPLQIHVFRRTKLSDSYQAYIVNFILFLTFILIGFWHGINVKFFCWGLLNATLVILSNKMIRLRFLMGEKLGHFVFTLITLFFIFLGQLLLLSDSLTAFMQNWNFLISWEKMTWEALVVAIILGIILFVQHQLDARISDGEFAKGKSFVLLVGIEIILAVLLHKSGGAFLYAQF